HTNIGNVRETFFFNQLNYKLEVNSSKQSDFLVEDKYTFEVGGKNKNKKQTSSIPNSFIVKDTIEIGTGNTIPLWLFGFLY
ncbi:ATPase, partial [hydrothermal vent metagenome]